jgi:hypothetical protein
MARASTPPRWTLAALPLLLVLALSLPALGMDSGSEYRIKAAYLYNFIAFTEWPLPQGSTLTLCIYGTDPYGMELDRYQGKVLGRQTLALRRTQNVRDLEDCQAVFISRSAIGNLPRVFDHLAERAVLTVADAPGAMNQGVMLNLLREQDKIVFEANLGVARAAKLKLSSKLLRLAVQVLR